MALGFALIAFVFTYLFLSTIVDDTVHEIGKVFWSLLTAIGIYLISAG
jgi:hypothetical protein